MRTSAHQSQLHQTCTFVGNLYSSGAIHCRQQQIVAVGHASCHCTPARAAQQRASAVKLGDSGNAGSWRRQKQQGTKHGCRCAVEYLLDSRSWAVAARPPNISMLQKQHFRLRAGCDSCCCNSQAWRQPVDISLQLQGLSSASGCSLESAAY